MKIGEIAAVTGTKVETVRYYEREGMMPRPERSAGNYRIYGEQQLQRLQFIRGARALGFSLDQVRDLLALGDDRSRSCEVVDDIARGHLSTIDRKLADLHSLRKELAKLVDACGQGRIAECRIMEALSVRNGIESSDRN